MDFREPTAIGARIKEVKGGYDHNYVLNSGGGQLALAATVYDLNSGCTSRRSGGVLKDPHGRQGLGVPEVTAQTNTWP